MRNVSPWIKCDTMAFMNTKYMNHQSSQVKSLQ